jgi:hypothetical protein
MRPISGFFIVGDLPTGFRIPVPVQIRVSASVKPCKVFAWLAIPKELLPVGEKAVIEHVVEAMTCTGIEVITIVVSPHKHGLSDYPGSGKRFGVHFNYVVHR